MVCVVLFVSLLATSAYKENRYGATPPFASVFLALQETYLSVRYAFESAIRRFPQYAAAGFTFSSALSFDRNDDTQRNARAIPVLTYHRIVSDANDLNNVTSEHFRDQMVTLKEAGWETITLKEYLAYQRGEIELPERSFLITFDDGAKESFYPVDPIFKMLGYEGVMYVIAAAAHTPESVYYLSPEEIRRMLDTGRWEIGSHSYDGHRPYPADATGTDGIFFADRLWRASDNRVETESEFTARVQSDLARARTALEQEYGEPIESFAFPLGNETGIQGAANFPAGAGITEREASRVYPLGFLQTNNQGYTFNPPGNGFISRRIHVDYDWDGARLLSIMENGLEKTLPYEDDFSENRGWISAWGALDLGRNNFVLQADDGASSASAFLDGSQSWDNYSFSASLDWRDGSVFVLADVIDSKTYHSCAFSEGMVRVQSTVAGETRVLAETLRPDVVHGANRSLGIRVHGSVIECLWNFASIAEAYDRGHSGLPEKTGGIGIQVWDPELGTASLTVSEVLVRPYETPAASSTATTTASTTSS